MTSASAMKIATDSAVIAPIAKSSAAANRIAATLSDRAFSLAIALARSTSARA
jgi:hypothetical protein